MIKSINYTSRFKKDLEKATKQKRDRKNLTEVIRLLATNSPLPYKFKDHKLIGNYKDRRECHIEPELLLIYSVDNDELTFERLGTHSELFK
jgi:mRNA interferase YafQ